MTRSSMEILTTTDLRSSAVYDAYKSVQEAYAGVSDRSIHKDSAQLHSAGLVLKREGLLGRAVAIEARHVLASQVQSTLQTQHRALTQIQERFARLRGEMMQTPKLRTNAELADEALRDLTLLLNTQSAEGRYVFGGNMEALPPVIDLTSPDAVNINAFGDVTTLYTGVVNSAREIVVSDHLRLTVGNVSAAHPAIAEMIGAINVLKTLPDDPGDPNFAAQTALLDQKIHNTNGLLPVAEFDLLTALKTCEDASKANDALQKEIQEELSSSDFVRSELEVAERLRAANDTFASLTYATKQMWSLTGRVIDSFST